jgi:hypothetical protein
VSPVRKLVLSLLIACAAADPSAARAAQPAFELRVEHGRVPESMRLIRVAQGDTVTLRWSVDRPMTLHLHGYDSEKRIEPGKPGIMSFEARATGRFPIKAHGAQAGKGPEEPLVYVEVYPR